MYSWLDIFGSLRNFENKECAMSDLQLQILLNSLPADLKKEAIDFIEFLKEKSRRSTKPAKRQAGLAKGMIEMKPDFDEPLDDLKDYM